MAKNKRKSKVTRSGKTSISGHKKVGKQLLPPYLAAGIRPDFISWTNDRLPEMLWALLIIDSLPRGYALSQFIQLFNFISDHDSKEELYDFSLTGIANLHEPLRSSVVEFIATPPGAAQALSDLLLFDSLPAREVWAKYLPVPELDWNRLMQAIGTALWHQSQVATDCRWVRLIPFATAGKVSISSHLTDLVEALANYPNNYEEAASRVRATEGGLSHLSLSDTAWPKAFWNELWEKTPCMTFNREYTQPSFEKTITHQSVSDLRKELKYHWAETLSTTAVDAKHDGIFGIAFYCLRILDEMMGIGVGTSILGRVGLRTIIEARINLKHLIDEDSPELWQQWRSYGTGQAKLNALRFEELFERPSFIDVASIEAIAFEDIGPDFQSVNLGSWSGVDLRKLSEKTGLKDTYDQHYSWASEYSHGMWGAIRESCYQVCANPLHRLHRYPERSPLRDTVDDAVTLIDEILQHIDEVFPSFSKRLGPGQD